MIMETKRKKSGHSAPKGVRAPKILVTGTHGFLGSAFVAFLRQRSIPYRTYDRTHPEQLPDDFYAVVHFGGITPYSAPKNAGYEEYHEANVEGTKQLLGTIASKKNLRRFVNIGSASEYGLSSQSLSEDAPEHPLNIYGKSKLAQSRLVEHFAREHHIRIFNLRIFNIIGLPERTLGKTIRIPNLFASLLAQFDSGHTITLSHEDSVRDYIDLEDLSEAIYRATQTDKGGLYEVINIATGQGHSLAEITRLFASLLARDYRIKNTSRTPDFSIGNPAKAKRILGWEPKIPFVESIRRMLGARNRVLIIGAGVAGRQVVGEIRKERRTDLIISGFVDDDPKKRNKRFSGVKVLGAIKDLPCLISQYSINQVLVSTPSIGKEITTRVAELVPPGFPIRVVPSVSSVLLRKVDLSSIRAIDPSDLVGRPLVKADQEIIARKAKGKIFLVTGGAGSIGSEIVRQLYSTHAKRIIILDAWEEGLFNLLEEFRDTMKEPGRPAVTVYMGNIRDRSRIDEILKKWKVDAILHAAAYKHVPLLEANPVEAHKTNYLGTKNLLDAAVKHHIRDFVLISTDKAVNPVSVLGKTKRAAELLMKRYAKKNPQQRFSAVRFGNVLNSSGSVIPVFLRQLREHRALTITHPEMTRYFMSIPEAVSLVLLSWIIAKNGQILLLDMGEPTKILDLALHLIQMNGLEPYKDVAIEEIGIRPGEKIHEELSYDPASVRQSSMKRIFIAEELQ